MPHYTARPERVNTGIQGLDEMVAEGFWRGTTTLVAGPPGSGKTIMALEFLRAGVSKGEPGVYLGFQENPTQLTRVMRNMQMPVEKLINDGFEIMYQSPVEMQLDTIAARLFERIRSGKVKRVVIDALGDLERISVDRQRFSNVIYALTQWFAVENVTCFMTYELTDLFEVNGISDQQVSNMSDNLILLRFQPGPELKRTLRIIKTRGSAHDSREHEIHITNEGLVIEEIGQQGTSWTSRGLQRKLIRGDSRNQPGDTTSLHFDKVLDIIVESALQLVEARACVLPGRRKMGRFACGRARNHAGVCRRVFRFEDEDAVRKLHEALAVTPDEAMVSVPVIATNSVNGMLAVVRSRPLDADEEWQLSAIADQAAIALQNARLFEIESAEAKRLRDATEIARRHLASIVESSERCNHQQKSGRHYQSWNEAASRVFGYSADEAIGRHIPCCCRKRLA